MDLTIENTGGAAVVVVPGDHLDAGNSEAFKQAMEPVLADNARVILDVGDLKFVDSSGLGAILSCLRKLTAREGGLKLCNMTKQVSLLFQLVRMNQIIEVFEDRAEALASLAE